MPDPVRAAARGRCPRCGAGRLYDGLLRFAPKCANCGLDYDSFNVGDGPAAFLTLIIGTIIVGLAMWLELALSPAWWVHVLLWTPIIFASTIGSLRISKAVLLALEYKHKAVEGRRSDRP